MIISVEGKNFDITNWDEIQRKLLWAVGFQLEKEVRDNILKYKLIGKTFQLQQSIQTAPPEGNSIEVFSDVPYAVYLEYGTFDFWKHYGLTSFPDVPIKKKDLTAKEREGLPKGMAPFAIFRRALYNEEIMKKIVQKGFDEAVK